MPHDMTGPAGSKPTRPTRPTMPLPPRRRASRRPDPRLALIHRTVIEQGVAYNPVALAEETGLPVDAIRRFAAQVVVERDMVELGMIEPEDAIRMGSEGLAASLRIVSRSYIDQPTPQPTPQPRALPLRAVDLMGLRRSEKRAASDRRAVVPPRTLCPRCGAVAGRKNGCGHQRVMTPTEAEQGLPHA